MMTKALRWTLALIITLLLSFAFAGVYCASFLLSLLPTGAKSYDPAGVARTLTIGRVKDLTTKFDDVFRELRRMMEKL